MDGEMNGWRMNAQENGWRNEWMKNEWTDERAIQSYAWIFDQINYQIYCSCKV